MDKICISQLNTLYIIVYELYNNLNIITKMNIVCRASYCCQFNAGIIKKKTVIKLLNGLR